MPVPTCYAYRACPALRLHLRACIPGYELTDILADVIFLKPSYIIDIQTDTYSHSRNMPSARKPANTVTRYARPQGDRKSVV